MEDLPLKFRLIYKPVSFGTKCIYVRCKGGLKDSEIEERNKFIITEVKAPMRWGRGEVGYQSLFHDGELEKFQERS